MRRRTIYLFVLLMGLASEASAGRSSWASINIGGATYAMSDVNDRITSFNELATDPADRLPLVDHGSNVGGAIGAGIFGDLEGGIAFDGLAAKSRVGDVAPAQLEQLFVRYKFVRSDPWVGFVSCAVGRVTVSRKIAVSVNGVPVGNFGLEGSGPSFQTGFGAQAWLWNRVALTSELGFRYALAKDMTWNGVAIKTADGRGYALDYSGALVRAGLEVSLTRR